MHDARANERSCFTRLSVHRKWPHFARCCVQSCRVMWVKRQKNTPSLGVTQFRPPCKSMGSWSSFFTFCNARMICHRIICCCYFQSESNLRSLTQSYNDALGNLEKQRSIIHQLNAKIQTQDKKLDGYVSMLFVLCTWHKTKGCTRQNGMAH